MLKILTLLSLIVITGCVRHREAEFQDPIVSAETAIRLEKLAIEKSEKAFNDKWNRKEDSMLSRNILPIGYNDAWEVQEVQKQEVKK